MNDSPWRPMGDCKLQGSSLCRRQGRVNHKEQSLNHERAYRPAHSVARERGHLGRVSGRRIGWADGLDLAFSGYFVENFSDFTEINLRSGFLSQEVLRKNPQFFSKSTRSSTVVFPSRFAKKSSDFKETNLRSGLLSQKIL